jgi:hypothetical protein
VDREEIFRRLDDYCRARFIELGERHLKRPVLKSYVVETRRGVGQPSVAVFADLGRIKQQDEDFYSIDDPQGPVGIIEKRSRFLILHTLLKTSEIELRVLRLTRSSLHTDNLWLDGDMLKYLFDVAVKVYGGRRPSRIAMEFEPYFDTLSEEDVGSEEMDDFEIEDSERSRPLNRISLSNKLGKLNVFVDMLYDLDFRSLAMVRFPSPTTSGGHEFYYYGKVTNRSDTFYAHRDVLNNVLDGYRALTERIEDLTWLGGHRDKSPEGLEAAVEGAPVVFRFDNGIPSNVYQSFLDVTFRKMRGPFRLVGNLIPAGKDRYHVYGLDMHLGQRVFLELSPKRFVVILPYGTCGNTVHRLAANIQRYLSQDLTITVGGEEYRALVREAFMIGSRKTD